MVINTQAHTVESFHGVWPLSLSVIQPGMCKYTVYCTDLFGISAQIEQQHVVAYRSSLEEEHQQIFWASEWRLAETASTTFGYCASQVKHRPLFHTLSGTRKAWVISGFGAVPSQDNRLIISQQLVAPLWAWSYTLMRVPHFHSHNIALFVLTSERGWGERFNTSVKQVELRLNLYTSC